MAMNTDKTNLTADIIQIIQSFLTTKEAARSSTISKTWYDAWIMRPGLDFDQRDFGRQRFGRHAQDIFWQFVTKTTQRYGSNLQSLSLRIVEGEDNCSRAEELIIRAIKLGATDVDFEVMKFRLGMFLPKEVLGSETLRRLSVRGCKIGLGGDRKARCSRLESLSLKEVVFTDVDMIWDIISSCPLIENLSLSDCKIVDDAGKIKRDKEIWRLRPYEKLTGSAVDGIINPFCKIKSLFLEKVVPIDISFFDDFGSKFPCLKDLSVHNCDGYHGIRVAPRSSFRNIFDYWHEIQITSSSLESISFMQNTRLKAKFDVPCIRKFMYKGTVLPSLSFRQYSRGGKSDISVTLNRQCHLPPWFRRLKKLLANFSQYEICLSLKILRFTDKSSDDVRDNGLPPIAVKDLMLYLEVPSSITSSFLKGLFWNCRPEFITLHLFPGEKRRNHDFLVLLNKTMVHGLSAVNFEVFYEGPAEWRGTPLETLLEASLSPEYSGKIRFQLR